jgi:hypothetical protein
VFHRPTTKALTVIELVIKQYIKSAEFIKLSDDKTSIAELMFFHVDIDESFYLRVERCYIRKNIDG